MFLVRSEFGIDIEVGVIDYLADLLCLDINVIVGVTSRSIYL